MIIFVTGATGFIGQHLVRRLVECGYQVRCLVRPSSRAAPLKSLGVELFYGDVNNRGVLLEGMTGCDWLFHLGNLYSMWEPDQRVFERVNVEGTCAAFECALHARIKKVVYVSTVAVYGKPDLLPFSEESQPGPCLFSAYARSKAAAERLAWDFHYQTGLPLVVLYPGIVLGPGDEKASGQYVRGLVNRSLPSTIFHRSRATYVAVEDVVEALVRAAELPQAVGQKYLLGETILSGGEFVQRVRAISGVALPLFRFPDWMVIAASHLLTALAGLVRRPPMWGLSVDAARTLKNGFTIDGSKAVRELGIGYHAIDEALRAAIATYQTPPGAHRRLLGSSDARRTAGAAVRIFDKKVKHDDGGHPGDRRQ